MSLEDYKTLEQFGLTRDAIQNGEVAEFDVVENKRKEKRPVYVGEVVDKVVELTFQELRNAYDENDNLEAQLTSAKNEVTNADNELEKLKSAAQVKSEDDAKLKKAENLLSDLSVSLSNFKKKRSQDAQQISDLQAKLENANGNNDVVDQLQARIHELEDLDKKRDDDYNALSNDVNAVLDALEARFSDLTV